MWEGSTTLLMGPAGSGKTTVAMHFALEGVARKEPTLYVNFQENPAQLARSFFNLGADVDAMRGGGLEFLYVSPVELQIDSLVGGIFERINDGTIRRGGSVARCERVRDAGTRQRVHN